MTQQQAPESLIDERREDIFANRQIEHAFRLVFRQNVVIEHILAERVFQVSEFRSADKTFDLDRDFAGVLFGGQQSFRAEINVEVIARIIQHNRQRIVRDRPAILTSAFLT